MDYQTEEAKIRSQIALDDFMQSVSDNWSIFETLEAALEQGEDYAKGFYKGWFKSREFYLQRDIERNESLDSKFYYLQGIGKE